MADAAPAITNGFNESSIECVTRGMCWFHCKNNTDKHVQIHDLEKRAKIISMSIAVKSNTGYIFSRSKTFS